MAEPAEGTATTASAVVSMYGQLDEQPMLVPVATPFTNSPVALSVPAPCAPPVGLPTVTPPLSVTLEAIGGLPAPPHFISVLTVPAAELAHVLALEKYGMPPLVPATVSAGVVVGVATEIKPPVKETLVTVPLPPPPPLSTQLPAEQV